MVDHKKDIKLFNVARRNLHKNYFRQYFKYKYDIDEPTELFNIISEFNKVVKVTKNIEEDVKLSPIKVKKKYEKEVNDVFTKLSDSDKIKKLPYLVYVISEEFGISIEYVIRSLDKKNVKKLRTFASQKANSHYFIKKEEEKLKRKCQC